MLLLKSIQNLKLFKKDFIVKFFLFKFKTVENVIEISNNAPQVLAAVFLPKLLEMPTNELVHWNLTAVLSMLVWAT